MVWVVPSVHFHSTLAVVQGAVRENHMKITIALAIQTKSA
jgi:hypothetical protein